jgi:hypothetical protein
MTLGSLLQDVYVEEMMDIFNCFLDLTYPLARPLSAVRISVHLMYSPKRDGTVRSRSLNTGDLGILNELLQFAQYGASLRTASEYVTKQFRIL